MVIGLETKRLILRKPKISDWKDIVEGCNEIEVARNTASIEHPYSKKQANLFILKIQKNWAKKDHDYVFFIELKSERKIIGGIALHDIEKNNGIAQTGSWINKNYWRKGYITEAKIAVNEFAFNKLKLRKLWTTVFTNNRASRKVHESIGYKSEGIFRKHFLSKATGIIHDANIYGLFKEDWKKKLPKLKKKLNDKIKKLK